MRPLILHIMLCFWAFNVLAAPAPTIIDKPIRFDQERIELTREYIKQHYGLTVKEITIVPKAIVIHWTATPSLKTAWNGFNRIHIRTERRYLIRGSILNVSAHFLVDRDGTIYRLMPETTMARHCIGLNYDSIGIENIGDGSKWPLTLKQFKANEDLIRYLTKKYKTIHYLLGHMEWKNFEAAPFFRERDPNYRNAKKDPGSLFMKKLRERLKDLNLIKSYQPN